MSWRAMEDRGILFVILQSILDSQEVLRMSDSSSREQELVASGAP
jgi:hypothetical protein